MLFLPSAQAAGNKEYLAHVKGFSGDSGKRIHLPMQEMQDMQVQSLGWEDPLEEEMVTHSSVLAWEIPQTEEPGGLQSMRSQKSWTRLSD